MDQNHDNPFEFTKAQKKAFWECRRLAEHVSWRIAENENNRPSIDVIKKYFIIAACKAISAAHGTIQEADLELIEEAMEKYWTLHTGQLWLTNWLKIKALQLKNAELREQEKIQRLSPFHSLSDQQLLQICTSADWTDQVSLQFMKMRLSENDMWHWFQRANIEIEDSEFMSEIFGDGPLVFRQQAIKAILAKRQQLANAEASNYQAPSSKHCAL